MLGYKRVTIATRSFFFCVSLGSGVPAGPQCHHSQSAAGTSAVENQHTQMGSLGPTQNHHMIAPSSRNWRSQRRVVGLRKGSNLWADGTIAYRVYTLQQMYLNFPHIFYFYIALLRGDTVTPISTLPNASTVVFKQHSVEAQILGSSLIKPFCFPTVWGSNVIPCLKIVINCIDNWGQW